MPQINRSKVIEELEFSLLKLNNTSYDSIDTLMRRIMKKHNLTAKELHNSFVSKHKQTPDTWIQNQMKLVVGKRTGVLPLGRQSEIPGTTPPTEVLLPGEPGRPIPTKKPSLPPAEKGKIKLPTIQKEHKSLVNKILEEIKNGEEPKCNNTKKGRSCPSHGTKECPSIKPHKSIEQIAKKHGVTVAEIKAQLKLGIQSEHEHTNDKDLAADIALQHLDEIPDYYTRLKKMETKESVTIEDMFGNVVYEFIDLIKCDSIIKESKKSKLFREAAPVNGFNPVTQTSPQKAATLALIQQKADALAAAKKVIQVGAPPIVEATRIPTKNGQVISTVLSWRGKTYQTQMFFPQIKVPNKREVTNEIQKIYPDSKVLTFRVCELNTQQPLIQVQNTKSKNFLLNNGGY